MDATGLSISMHVDYDSAPPSSQALPYKIHTVTGRCITNSIKMAAVVKASGPLAQMYPLIHASMRIPTLQIPSDYMQQLYERHRQVEVKAEEGVNRKVC